MSNNPSPLSDEDREDLIAYLDGEVSEVGEEKAQILETRMNLDPTVRAEADSFKRTWDLLDYLPKPEVSPSFTNRTLDKLSVRETQNALRPPRRLRRRMIAGWTAAVFLAAVGGYAAVAWMSPPDPRERDLVRELRLIENLRYYETVDVIQPDNSLQFLEELARPELFGDDNQDS
jgi:anti-sigma factor RsiW